MDVNDRSHCGSTTVLTPMAEDPPFSSIESPPYFDSSSEVAGLEVCFLQSFKCCGLKLSSFRDLVEHKETDAHKEKESEPQPIIMPDPTDFMQRSLSDYSQDELRRLGKDLPELELNTTSAPAATLVPTEPGTLRRKIEEQERQQIQEFKKDVLEVNRTAHRSTITVTDVAAYIRGLKKQEPVLLVRSISPALLESSFQTKHFNDLQAAARKHQQRQRIGMPNATVSEINGYLPYVASPERARARHMQPFAQEPQQQRPRPAEPLRRIAHVTAARRNLEIAAAGGSPQRAALYAQEFQAAKRRIERRYAGWFEIRARIDRLKALLHPGHQYPPEVARRIVQGILAMEKRAQVLQQQELPAKLFRNTPHVMRNNQPRVQTDMSLQVVSIKVGSGTVQSDQHPQQAGRLQSSPLANTYQPVTPMGIEPLEQSPQNDIPPQQAENPRVSATLNNVNAASLQIRNRAHFLKQYLGSLHLPSRGVVLGPNDSSGASSSSQAQHIQAWEAARQQKQRKHAEWLRNIDPELLKARPCTAGQPYNAGPPQLDGISDVEMAD